MAFLSAEYQPCSFCQQKTQTNTASTAVRLHYTKVKSRTNTVYASTLVLKCTFLVLITIRYKYIIISRRQQKYNYNMFGDHY